MQVVREVRLSLRRMVWCELRVELNQGWVGWLPEQRRKRWLHYEISARVRSAMKARSR